jgi:ankyrin repeat protein
MMNTFGLLSLSLLGIGILLYFLRSRIPIPTLFRKSKIPAEHNTFEHFLASVKYDDINQVKELLENFDIDINEAGFHGSTALHVASSLGHYEIVKYLLTQEKIDVNKTNPNDSSPLEIAEMNGLKNIAELLREKGAK